MSDLYNRLYNTNSMTLKAISLIPSYFVFHTWYHFLKKSQTWSEEKIKSYQFQRFKSLITHAYEHVPYYQSVFDERGLKPADFKSFEDIEKLPLLTKKIIREHRNELKAINYPDSSFEPTTTGGFSGPPLTIYYEKGVSRAIEWAFIKTLWDRVDYHFLDKCVYLRGIPIRHADDDHFWKYSFFKRWLLLSPFHLSEKNIPKYIRKIREFNPRFIQAFPSEILPIAEYIQNNNIDKLKGIKAILCGSETLFPWQRHIIEEQFNCRVFSWYGLTEQTVLAGECEKSSDFHIFSEYGIVELIDWTGEKIRSVNKTGEIVATSLTNYVMPLIRYRTGDLAHFTNNEQCECRRQYERFGRIDGRLFEFIYTKSGRKITLLALISFLREFRSFQLVEDIQLIQKRKGELILNIVKSKHYSRQHEQEIIERIEKEFSNELTLHLQYVDNIDRTIRGKRKLLIQEIK